MKKAELVAIAESHDIDVSGMTKDEITETLEAEGISADAPQKKKTETKADRQARLRAR